MIRFRLGQSALEFVLIFGTVLFFFVLMLGAFQSNIHDKVSEKQDRELREIVNSVHDEISLASSSSDGYRRSFTVPQDVLGLPYSIQIVDDLVFGKTNDERHAVVSPIERVTGNILLGTNVIRKENGSVYLN